VTEQFPRPNRSRIRDADAARDGDRGARAGRRRRATRDAPEVPEGTPLVSMTVREALRDAMAEEMRRDERVFVMGEEVASIRAPTRSPRACSGVRPKRVVDTPITEYGFAGLGTGAAMGGLGRSSSS
jgi:hypothetical protein